MCSLNPGIRKTVEWLGSHGFRTCDSGDGKTRDFECDLPMPYVHIIVPRTGDVVDPDVTRAADRLAELLVLRGIKLGEAYDPELVANPDPARVGQPYIEASYNPVSDVNFVSLYNCDDAVMGFNPGTRDGI